MNYVYKHVANFTILTLEVVLGDNLLLFTVLIFTVLSVKEDEPILRFLYDTWISLVS